MRTITSSEESSHVSRRFLRKSNRFFSYMTGLAQAADAAQRGVYLFANFKRRRFLCPKFG